MGSQKFSLKKTHANYLITLGTWLKQKGGLNLGNQGQRTRPTTLMVAQEVVGRDAKRNISNKAKLNEISNNFTIKKLLLGFHQTKKASYK